MFINENNFFKPISKHQYLSSPTMHREELEYMREAYETNWMSTVGANINEVEKPVSYTHLFTTNIIRIRRKSWKSCWIGSTGPVNKDRS